MKQGKRKRISWGSPLALRNEIGASQQQLANILGVSKSAINMYERSERGSPEYNIYSLLSKAMDEKDKPGNLGELAEVEQRRRLAEDFDKRKLSIDVEILRLSRELKIITENYSLSVERLKNLSKIEMTGIPQQGRLSLEHLISEMKSSVYRWGLIRQSKIRSRIAALELELDLIPKMIG